MSARNSKYVIEIGGEVLDLTPLINYEGQAPLTGLDEMNVWLRAVRKEYGVVVFSLFVKEDTPLRLAKLTPDEVAIIEHKIMTIYRELVEKGLKEYAELWKAHIPYFIFVAKWAKAVMDNKPIRAWPEPNAIAVEPIIPQFIKYVATPDSTNPAYTDYQANSWNITLQPGRVQGTSNNVIGAYVFGSFDTSTQTVYYWQPPSAQGYRFVIALPYKWLIGYGDSPGINQAGLASSDRAKLQPYALDIFIDVPEHDVPMPVYPIPLPATFVGPDTPGLLVAICGPGSSAVTKQFRINGLAFLEFKAYSTIKSV